MIEDERVTIPDTDLSHEQRASEVGGCKTARARETGPPASLFQRPSNSDDGNDINEKTTGTKRRRRHHVHERPDVRRVKVPDDLGALQIVHARLQGPVQRLWVDGTLHLAGNQGQLVVEDRDRLDRKRERPASANREARGAKRE
jgi:hypothetical protein